MTEMAKLILSASDGAELRGHNLGTWKIGETLAHAHCANCHWSVYVDVGSSPNIFGHLVGRDCPGSKTEFPESTTWGPEKEN